MFEKLKEGSKTNYVSPVVLAVVPMLLGDLDAAFELLDQAYAEKANALVYVNVEPFFDPLRSHPRFAELIAKMGFPV